MPDTKIAVVEQGVYAPNQETIFWEPLVDQGLVAREQNVFEGYDAPVPQTTAEAIEDTSAHEFDDLTQVYSVTFVGRQLLFCPHPEVVEERSPIQRTFDRWRDMPERERRAVFEGSIDRIWSREINLDSYELAWDLTPAPNHESPAYFREVQHRTPAADFQIEITITDEMRQSFAAIANRITPSALGVPIDVLNPVRANALGAYGRGLSHEYFYDRFIQSCMPWRSRGMGGFYCRTTRDEYENLGIEL